MSGLPFRLRALPLTARLGFTFVVGTLGVGLAASAAHLVGHHENRDEIPGLSMEDLTGAYHGVKVTAPLVVALERGHPDDLADADRDTLMAWLTGERVSEDYDSLDLGDAAPAEVLDAACLSCHSRQATAGDGIGQTVPLDYWDDVAKVAFSREVSPTDPKVLVASAHTHALTMGALTALVALLGLATRFARRAAPALVMVAGAALFCDLCCWFLARDAAWLVGAIAAAGTLWMGSMALLGVLVLMELWLPAEAD
ncbi:MAG: hypothetical protein QF410_10100 [Planctomycetota bacterium]|jgi:hypothetical protein|nr:hypothetical protein [Planctomycetota bacterium]MDP6762443.1 hypothetical protein [Planctomycetota bacterium]